MDTNKLKRFAGEARVKLKAGVASMLQLYGFDADGNTSTMPERITGGAIFNDTGSKLDVENATFTDMAKLRLFLHIFMTRADDCGSFRRPVSGFLQDTGLF